MKKVYFLALITIFARLLDVISTILATPNLERELNPLVTILNAGWTGIIILNIIVCFIFY